jgi:hypothetical protein
LNGQQEWLDLPLSEPFPVEGDELNVEAVEKLLQKRVGRHAENLGKCEMASHVETSTGSRVGNDLLHEDKARSAVCLSAAANGGPVRALGS